MRPMLPRLILPLPSDIIACSHSYPGAATPIYKGLKTPTRFWSKHTWRKWNHSKAAKVLAEFKSHYPKDYTAACPVMFVSVLFYTRTDLCRYFILGINEKYWKVNLVYLLYSQSRPRCRFGLTFKWQCLYIMSHVSSLISNFFILYVFW